MKQEGHGLPVYTGRYNLRGYGLGGTIISNIFKQAIPFLKPIAKKVLSHVRKEAIRTGRNIAQDVLVNKMSAKKSIKNRAKESFNRLIQEDGNQTGSGSKRVHTSHPSKIKKTTIRDIFLSQGKRKAPRNSHSGKKRKTINGGTYQ